MITFACVCGGVGEAAAGAVIWPWLVALFTAAVGIVRATKKESVTNESL
jgi:hypothetical protein